MSHRLLSRALLAVVAAAGFSGCGGGGGGSTPTAPSSQAPPPPTAATVTVSVVGSTGNRAYEPNPVRAAVGDTVMFRNSDTTTHRIVMDDGSQDLGDLAPGASRGFTLRNGTALAYHCTIHPTMVGSINGATAPDPPCIDVYGYSC